MVNARSTTKNMNAKIPPNIFEFPKNSPLNWKFVHKALDDLKLSGKTH